MKVIYTPKILVLRPVYHIENARPGANNICGDLV